MGAPGRLGERLVVAQQREIPGMRFEVGCQPLRVQQLKPQVLGSCLPHRPRPHPSDACTNECGSLQTTWRSLDAAPSHLLKRPQEVGEGRRTPRSSERALLKA